MTSPERAGPFRSLVRPAAAAVEGARQAAEALAHEAIEVRRRPSRLGELAATARADMGALAKVLFAGADPQTPLKGDLGTTSRVVWSEPIPLEDVKATGHQTGTTVNDVLLTAVAGSLGRYLWAHGATIDELTVLVPFNLRPLDRPLPPELGNRFGLVFLRLPVGIEDPLRRLEKVHARMEEIKHSPEGAVSYGVLGAIGRTPVQLEKMLVDLISTKGSAVITNVPGPRQPVYLAGTPVRGVLVWAPCSGGVSMSVSIFSYAGEVTLGVMTDAGLVPDPETIVTAFEPELGSVAGAAP